MNYTIFVILGILAVSIFSVSGIANAETSAKSTAFEKTSLLEFTNNDATPIQSIKMWLKDGASFKSFKSEKGWIGTKTPQGVLVFSSTEPLASGQSVKFGIKTDIESPGVNWRTIDNAGNEISTGKVIPGQVKSPDTKPANQPPANTTPQDTKQSSFDNAVFKIIPENPKNGDNIRIVGEGFAPNTYLDFLINDSKIQDFKTDDTGHLVGRAKIPVTLESGRIDITLADSQGHKKTISIRISSSEQAVQPSSTKRLTVDQFNGIAEPGQKVSVNGTDTPGKSVKITAKDPAGNKIYEAVVQVNNQGKWSHETTIPFDAPLGTRQIDISDGVDTITKTISISVSKTIKLTPSATKYNIGDKFVFNGTAKGGQSLQITINDPIGKEIFSDIINPDDSGSFNFEYPTTQSSPKGTYVIFATQGEAVEIVRVGLGELPSPQIVAKLDKLNYLSSDTAKITIQGTPKSTVSVLVVDPSDKVKLTESVTLDLDGSKTHEINLNGYKSGIYTIIVKQTQSQIKLVFSVGLQTTTGTIVAQTTKTEYLPGEGILLLGTTDPNTILNLEMSDPDSTIIKRKDIFADKTGKFSEGTFRVPADAKQGPWILKVKSGAKFTDVKFTVTGTIEKTFTVKLDKTVYHSGDRIDISGIGGGKSQTVVITILDSKNVKVTELQIRSTRDGSFDTIWPVPSNTEPGKYTIKATVGQDTAEATFDLQ